MRAHRSKSGEIVIHIAAQFPPEPGAVSRVAEPEDRYPAALGGAPAGAGYILVADDEPAVREAVRTGLEYLGYRVRAVGDGTAALSVARTDPPRLFILDLYMPQAGGLAVLEEIQADPRLRGVPVLFLTGSPAEIPSHPAIAAVLAKPVRIEALAERVQAILAGEPPA